MRDPARIDAVLTALGAYWRSSPDLRLAQIIGNAHGKPTDSYQMEDSVLLDYLSRQAVKSPESAPAITILCDSALAIETDHLDASDGPTEEECARIRQIAATGHPFHCAARQVWGDGECECREATIAHLRSLSAEGLIGLLREARVCREWQTHERGDGLFRCLVCIGGSEVATVEGCYGYVHADRYGTPDLEGERAAEDAAIAAGYRVPWRQT